MPHTASDIAPPGGYLSGQLLIATPRVNAFGFAHSVILISNHDERGAMGIIINHIIENVSYETLFEELKITPGTPNAMEDLPVHYGGPVEINRGFVLYHCTETPPEDSFSYFPYINVAISSSLHILRDIAAGNGPTERLLALGYAGWSPGQLEAEIEDNSWISVPASRILIFNTPNEHKWQLAAGSLGIDISKLATEAGHA